MVIFDVVDSSQELAVERGDRGRGSPSVLVH